MNHILPYLSGYCSPLSHLQHICSLWCSLYSHSHLGGKSLSLSITCWLRNDVFPHTWPEDTRFVKSHRSIFVNQTMWRSSQHSSVVKDLRLFVCLSHRYGTIMRSEIQTAAFLRSLETFRDEPVEIHWKLNLKNNVNLHWALQRVHTQIIKDWFIFLRRWRGDG